MGAGFESGLVEGLGVGGGYGSSNFESSSYSLGAAGGIGGFGVESNLAASTGGNYSSSSHESQNFASRGAGGATGFDIAAVAFNTVDKNKDGIVDANEFKQFFHGGF